MSAFWDKVKEIFKSDEQKAEEKSKKLNEALNGENSIVAKLAELEKAYLESLPKREEPDVESLFPKSLGLQYVEVDDTTDEELLNRARSEYVPLLEADKLSKTEDYDNKIGTINAKSEKSAEEYEDDLSQLYDAIDGKKKGVVEKAIRQGVARSTILTEGLDDLSLLGEQTETELGAQYAEEVKGYDAEIAKLSAQLDTSIAELDLSYATKINEKLNKLKESRDKAVASAIKYNNSVDEKEKQYTQSRETKIQDYLTELARERKKQDDIKAKQETLYGYAPDKQWNYSKRYDVAKEYYMALSPDIAAEALEASPNMKYYLGNFYTPLLLILKSRLPSKKEVF